MRRTLRPMPLRLSRVFHLAFCLCLLAGCAAQNAFRHGNELISAGKTTEGLTQLAEASRLEPGSAQYRMAYLQARDRALQAPLSRAADAVSRGASDSAEQAYRQVLMIEPGEPRAMEGLRALESKRRWDQAVNAAEASMGRKDWSSARAKLHPVLAESPRHAQALTLLQRIEDQSARPAPDVALSGAYRKSISIEFKDVPLKTVFEIIARTSGMNFVFDKDVRTDQRTSIYLKNSTIEAAISLALVTNQLEQRVLDANSVLIYPNTQAKQREYQPLTIKSFYLANAEAKNVANTVKTLLKTRDVVVDEKLNLLIMRDTPDAVRMAEKLIALHDVADAEVMLEVEVLEVQRGRLLDLGISWPDQLSLTPLPSTAGGTLTLSELRHLRSSTVGTRISPLVVNAKKTDTDANILANPRIRVRNHEKAKILIGERVPNITATSTSTGFVAESVNYVDVGLKLEVEPTINLDDDVAIKISLEVSNIINQLQTKSGTLAYQIGTRTATTVLRLKDGENQVLAGLINDEDRRSASNVPGLGEIPVVGHLFGSHNDDKNKTEIVLSITPRIMRNVRRPDAAILEFDSGTEASLRGGVREIAAAGSNEPGTTPSAGARDVQFGPKPSPSSTPTPMPGSDLLQRVPLQLPVTPPAPGEERRAPAPTQ